MRFSFSTNAFVTHSLLDAVEKIAGLGYEGVEILADTPHLYPHSVNASDLARLGRLLTRLNLQVVNVNANTAVGYYGRTFWEPLFEPSLANPDQSARRWRIDYSIRCVDIARALGSPNVSLTSGRMIPGTPPEQGLCLLRESLKEVLDHAERKDVRIGLEYEPGLLVERYEELGRLIDEIGSPYFGANLDLGHSHVLGEEPEEVIGRLSDALFHLHLEDIRDRKHYHLVPGLGDMDFGTIFRSLRQRSYAGFLTVELYTYPQDPEGAGRRALAHLREVESAGVG
jgi:sugar phosphate isomerase/epimerase